MINLRFHMVSLVAVFFALAIGIAVGATVVDQGVLSRTEAQITQLDKTLKQRDRQINALRAEVASQRKVVEAVEPRAVARSLVDNAVAIVRLPGVSDGTARVVRELLTEAGANVQAELAIAPRWELGDAEDLERAALAVGATSRRPSTIRFLLDDRLAAALLDPLVSPTLESLRTSGFLSTPGDVPLGTLLSTTRIVMVGGADSELSAGVVLSMLSVQRDRSPARTLFVDGETTGPSAAVVASAEPNASVSNVLVRRIRKDDGLATAIATLDTLRGFAGRVGLVMAVADLGSGVVGHYGIDQTAKSLVPQP